MSNSYRHGNKLRFRNMQMKLDVRHHGTVGSTIRLAEDRRRVARPKGALATRTVLSVFRRAQSRQVTQVWKHPTEPDAIGLQRKYSRPTALRS